MSSTIVPRAPHLELAGVPRAWVAGSQAATAISNGLNLLFPHGERFFVRSVKHFLDVVDDPGLKSQVRGFFAQEGRHAHAHDDFNQVLRSQGYEIDQFLTNYQRLSSWLEAHMPAKLRLAVTAAAEHFTAILAHGAFTQGVLDRCDPRMQELLAWHAAEEIEHKAVAFDVLAKVDPSYALRIAGLVAATVLLGGFWTWGAARLLAQDGYTLRSMVRELRTMPNRDPVIARVFASGIRRYLRRDFHPDDVDDRELAAAWFAARGVTMPAPIPGKAA